MQFVALLAAAAAMFGATFAVRSLVSTRHENITVSPQTTPVPRSAEPAWVKAFDELDLRMQQDHIDALTGQADLAVLTSEVMHHVTVHVPGGSDRNTGESWSLIGAEELDKRIPPSMEIVASNAWSWPRIRATPKSPGARMDVGALAVRPRASG